jgi:hypothetical protein
MGHDVVDVVKYDPESEFRAKPIDVASAVEISGYIGSRREIRIPPSIRGLPVTSIGKEVFASIERRTIIHIPDTVTSIGDRAFYKTFLVEIIIPDGVTSIGSEVFVGTGLGKITIPDSVTFIGARAFAVCDFTSITIPNSVTSIEEGTFMGCENLTSVTIPNSVTAIGKSAFFGCTWLASVTIPDSVTSNIEIETFKGCTSLASSPYLN